MTDRTLTRGPRLRRPTPLIAMHLMHRRQERLSPSLPAHRLHDVRATPLCIRSWYDDVLVIKHI